MSLFSPGQDLESAAAHLRELIAELVAGIRNGVPSACLARFFHVGLAALLSQAVSSVAQPQTLIGLTGGVCANRLLTTGITKLLTASGFEPIVHRLVPANDGGLALGQALAGYLTLTKGKNTA
jgi:hydrogenase maturation protein HypF